MRVVIDANIIVQDFRLTGTSSRLLLDNLKQTGHELVAPEVVVQEAVNKFREMLREDVKKMQGLAQSASRKLGEDVQPSIFPGHVKGHVADYEAYLRERLKSHGALVPPFPAVAHEEIVQRALARRKPFSSDGRKGYRDALIWETVRDLAKEDPDVAFITTNNRDFAGPKDLLHPDLREDLKADGSPEEKVKLFLRVDRFLDEHVIPHLPPVDQTIAKLLQAAPAGFTLETAISEALHDSLYGQEISAYALGKPNVIETPSIDGIQNVDSLDFTHEASVSESEVVLQMEATLDCEFDGFVFKGDYFAIETEDQPFIWDENWNDHYYAVSFSAGVSVRAYVTVDLAAGSIGDVEVLDIEGINPHM